MANTLRFKRGLEAGIPTAVAGEPLFTTDTFDLYIGNGTTNTRFQKYIASGTTLQYLRGDGTLATFPLLTGFVPYTGATANVDLGVYTILAQNATIASSGSTGTAIINHTSGSGIGLNITKGGNGEGLYINKTSGSGNAATIIGTLNATTLVKSGGLSTEYLKADGSVSTLTNPVTGTGVSGQVAYWSGTNTQVGSNNLFWDNTNARLGVGTNTPSAKYTQSQAQGVFGRYEITDANADQITGSWDVYTNTLVTPDFFGKTAFKFEGGSNNAARQYQIYVGDISTPKLAINGSGSLMLGSVVSTGQRLQVTGDTLLKGSGNTSATTALTVQNSDGANLIRSRNDGALIIGSRTSEENYIAGYTSTSPFGVGQRTLAFVWGTGSGSRPNPSFYFTSASNINYTSTSGDFIQTSFTFNPTSGTGIINTHLIAPTINQTGGANGITRGLYVSPTLTAAADWRSIEWSNNTGWGLYGAGTANSYFGGSVGIGTTSLTGNSFRVAKALTGATNVAGIYNDGQVQSDVTSAVRMYRSTLNIVDSVFTIPNAYHYLAEQGTIGASSSVTNQYGYITGDLTKGTNNYAFFGSVSSGTGRWNLYMNGTANNYMAGSLGIGTTSPSYKMHVFNAGSVTSAIESSGGGTTASLRLISPSNYWLITNDGTNGHLTFNRGASDLIRFSNLGRIIAGSIGTDTGELLQVNGTMKVTGASTFGGNMAVDTNTFFVDSVNNRVGVGTVTPTQTFEVTGNQRITSGFFEFFGGVVYPQISRNNTTGGFILNTSGTVSLSNSLFSVRNNSGSDYLTIFGSGAATFSSSVTAASLNVTGASTFGGNLGGGNQRVANFRNSGGNGYIELQSSGAGAVALWAASGNEFAIYQNATAGTIGTNVFHITSTANVGISTFTPAYKLDVNGTFGATGAATFSSTLTTGGNILIGATASTVGAMNLIRTGTSPVASRLTFGTDGTGYSFAIGKNQAGTVTDLFSILDSGAANFTTSIQAGTAIAIGTTPDTNKPFKILKNINATVGINFENTSTSSLAFSAIQMGTDVTGGTAFTNLVYGSSGITEAGAYKPSGTSLVNTGAGGLNFLAVSQPIRFFTSSGNGTLRASITNDGDYTQFNGTNPAASTTDAFRMYSADVVAGNAAPHFRTENGAVIKIYQETTGVGNAIFSAGGGTGVLDDSTFDGYTLRQIVKALRNQGILA